MGVFLLGDGGLCVAINAVDFCGTHDSGIIQRINATMATWIIVKTMTIRSTMVTSDYYGLLLTSNAYSGLRLTNVEQ